MYHGPDKRRYSAPTTFTSKRDARNWLALRQSEIIQKAWTPPQSTPKGTAITFADYADQWLAHRELKQRSRELYRNLLDRHLLPVFGAMPLTAITADDIRTWYTGFDKSTPTLRSQCYGMVRTVLGTAASDGIINANPCVIRGASSVSRVDQITPASLEEIDKIASAMPDRYAAMILLAAWCALRFGEVTELRRRDIDLDPDKQWGVIRVRRAVVRTNDGFQVTTPKSDAGIRDVAIPPHLIPVLADHLAIHVGQGRDALLFASAAGRHLPQGTLHKHFSAARKVANRTDLRFHDLRHSGAVLAAQSGATLSELMGRLGHSFPAMAMKYQHVAAGRDQQIAQALSRIAQQG
jgi:integrase